MTLGILIGVVIGNFAVTCWLVWSVTYNTSTLEMHNKTFKNVINTLGDIIKMLDPK